MIEKQGHKYQARYCEENIWHLCQEPCMHGLLCSVLVVTSAAAATPLLRQRAGGGEVVWWDYHVILLTRMAETMIWDLDTELPLPCLATRYFAATFPNQIDVREPHCALIREIDADVYVETLCSDRRHMCDEAGAWLAPPPPWPTIGMPGTHNLPDLVAPFNNGLGRLVPASRASQEWV